MRATGTRGGYGLLFAAQALAVGATTSSLTMSSIIASQLGHESVAGLPATVNTFSQALAAYPFGMLMARTGWRFGLVGAYALGVLGATVGFLGAFTRDFALFLLGGALVGAAQGGYQQGRYAAADSVPPERRAAAMGALLFGSVLGSLLATLAAPALDDVAHRFGTTSEVAGWSFAALLLLVSAALTFAWQGRTRSTVAERAGPGSAARAWRNPDVRRAALALCASQGVMVTLMVLTPLRAHHLGHSHTAVAGLLTLHFLGMFGFGWLVGPLVDRRGARFGLLAATVLLLLAATLLPASHPVALGASIFLLGLGWNFGYVSGSSLLSAHRAAQGLVDALTYASAGLGALLGSVVAARFGFGALALLGVTASLLPAVAALRGLAGTKAMPAD